MSKKGRVFSGARPTGRQHLGNYLGAIQNYVALQDDYDCIYCIVDIHALTTVETTADLKDNTYEMALDWLAAGIRADESIVFVQSHVPQVMELHTMLQRGELFGSFAYMTVTMVGGFACFYLGFIATRALSAMSGG